MQYTSYFSKSNTTYPLFKTQSLNDSFSLLLNEQFCLMVGFLSGLWHGFIVVFSILGKLFGFDIGIGGFIGEGRSAFI